MAILNKLTHTNYFLHSIYSIWETYFKEALPLHKYFRGGHSIIFKHVISINFMEVQLFDPELICVLTQEKSWSGHVWQRCKRWIQGMTPGLEKRRCIPGRCQPGTNHGSIYAIVNKNQTWRWLEIEFDFWKSVVSQQNTFWTYWSCCMLQIFLPWVLLMLQLPLLSLLLILLIAVVAVVADLVAVVVAVAAVGVGPCGCCCNCRCHCGRGPGGCGCYWWWRFDDDDDDHVELLGAHFLQLSICKPSNYSRLMYCSWSLYKTWLYSAHPKKKVYTE